MSRNKSLRIPSAALFVILIAITGLVPGAWSQSKYESLYSFTGGTDGRTPSSDLIFDPTGNLYGTTRDGGAYGFGTVFKLAPNADGTWTESVLYSFCLVKNCADGGDPVASLILDQAGGFYGTTGAGGANGGGAVFKLTPHADGSWTQSVLYSFCSLTNCADGMSSSGSLIFDQVGNLYGTAVGGGSASCVGGCGVVFELIPHSDGSWKEKVLHRFNGNDGAEPDSGLILDATGNLYGTTGLGGTETCNAPLGCGVVFKLTPNTDGSWKEKVLHRFTGNDGTSPVARLILDQAGNLYGTTAFGGNLSQCEGNGCGVVFELTPNGEGGWREKILHHFAGGSDGRQPYADLIFDQAGNLYGTTYDGGGDLGVVFKLVPNSNGTWKEKLLHKFVNGIIDAGTRPYAGLIFDAKGNLYGTTTLGGESGYCRRNGCGVVFELMPN
jgi:uncharacterized repeat protein (TIGR03803 family)